MNHGQQYLPIFVFDWDYSTHPRSYPVCVRVKLEPANQFQIKGSMVDETQFGIDVVQTHHINPEILTSSRSNLAAVWRSVAVQVTQALYGA
jgi:hypothetical protein